MTNEPNNRGEHISAEVAAALIRVSSRRLRQLTAEGWIKKEGRGQYTIKGVVHGYIAFKDDEIRRARNSDADNRLRDARAREIELRTARQEGELVPIAEANAMVCQVVGRMISLLVALPARVTRDVRLRREIENAIDEVRSQLAEELVTLGEEYRRGPPPDGEAAE